MTEQLSHAEIPDRVKGLKDLPVLELGHEVDYLTNLYWTAGKATYRSVVDRDTGLRRTLHNRVERASILKRLKGGEITREQAIEQGKRIDSIDRQFLNQKELTIDLPGLGEQKVYYAEIIPEKSEDVESDLPPIFLIPAFSGDAYGVSPLMLEAAYSGRRIISVAYPESLNGTTTPEFAHAVEENSSYSPHTDFFKQAINILIGHEEMFEIWGYSTGGAILAEILHDPSFQERVTNAVAYSPASNVNQTQDEFNKSIRKEMFGFARSGFAGFADSAFVMGRASDVTVDRSKKFKAFQTIKRLIDDFNITAEKSHPDPEKLALRKRVSKALLSNKIQKGMNLWEGAHVRGDGKIIIFSAENDQLTKTNEVIENLPRINSQVQIIDYIGGIHLTALTNARRVIKTVSDLHNNPDTRVIEMSKNEQGRKTESYNPEAEENSRIRPKLYAQLHTEGLTPEQIDAAFQRMKELGASPKIGFYWNRLFPERDQLEPNPDILAIYRTTLEACKKYGLTEPIFILEGMPEWTAKAIKENPQSVYDAFRSFSEFSAKILHENGVKPPIIQISNEINNPVFNRFPIEVIGQLCAEAKSSFEGEFQNGEQPLTMLNFLPLGSTKDYAEKKLKRIIDRFDIAGFDFYQGAYPGSQTRPMMPWEHGWQAIRTMGDVRALKTFFELFKPGQPLYGKSAAIAEVGHPTLRPGEIHESRQRLFYSQFFRKLRKLLNSYKEQGINIPLKAIGLYGLQDETDRGFIENSWGIFTGEGSPKGIRVNRPGQAQDTPNVIRRGMDKL